MTINICKNIKDIKYFWHLKCAYCEQCNYYACSIIYSVGYIYISSIYINLYTQVLLHV